MEGCLVGGTEDGDGSDCFGIVGRGPLQFDIQLSGRILVTRNTVIGNGNTGILVGANSTVTHSTVSNDLVDGINVGAGSLVTSNTSNDNVGDGIEAVCKSTVTHNTALGNDGENFNPVGQGCVVLHNNFTDPE